MNAPDGEAWNNTTATNLPPSAVALCMAAQADWKQNQGYQDNENDHAPLLLVDNGRHRLGQVPALPRKQIGHDLRREDWIILERTPVAFNDAVTEAGVSP